MNPDQLFGLAEHHHGVSGVTALQAGVMQAARLALTGQQAKAQAVYGLLQGFTAIEPSHKSNFAGVLPSK